MEFIPINIPKETIEEQGYGLDASDYMLLRNRRLELGLTQQQVADKAKIQLRQYQRVESGERHIRSASIRMALAICAVLKINPYEFFPEYSKVQS